MKFSRVALRVVAGIVFGTSLMGSPRSTAAETTHWVSAWAIALQAVPEPAKVPALYRAPVVVHRTVRQIVFPGIGARVAKIHLSNAGGKAPLTIGAATVARTGRGAAIRPASERLLTFSGRTEVTLAPGAQIDSDPVNIEVRAGQPLTVSLYVANGEIPTAWHRVSNQINYVSAPGNHVSDVFGDVFKERITHYLWLDRVSVDAAPSVFAVAAIGDSITDGLYSSLNANRRWPDAYARRLRAAGAGNVSVLNLGIAGNRLLNDSACYGEKLAGRFSRDALDQPGVRAAIVLIGINDINFSSVRPAPGFDCGYPRVKVSVPELIAGYQHLIDKAHRKHIKLYGATLSPAGLPAEREAMRRQVNHWIRTSGAFDGVADFDAALQDPAHPNQMRRRFDSGDHIHPSDAGYDAMGAAVPLGWFEPKGK